MNTQLSQVNIAALAAILTEKLGFEVLLDSKIVTGRDDKERIRISSPNVKDKAGIMAVCFDSLHIENFGGGITGDSKGYWMPVYFNYEYIRGGSNGCEICTAYYDFTTS